MNAPVTRFIPTVCRYLWWEYHPTPRTRKRAVNPPKEAHGVRVSPALTERARQLGRASKRWRRRAVVQVTPEERHLLRDLRDRLERETDERHSLEDTLSKIAGPHCASRFEVCASNRFPPIELRRKIPPAPEEEEAE